MAIWDCVASANPTNALICNVNATCTHAIICQSNGQDRLPPSGAMPQGDEVHKSCSHLDNVPFWICLPPFVTNFFFPFKSRVYLFFVRTPFLCRKAPICGRDFGRLSRPTLFWNGLFSSCDNMVSMLGCVSLKDFRPSTFLVPRNVRYGLFGRAFSRALLKLRARSFASISLCPARTMSTNSSTGSSDCHRWGICALMHVMPFRLAHARDARCASTERAKRFSSSKIHTVAFFLIDVLARSCTPGLSCNGIRPETPQWKTESAIFFFRLCAAPCPARDCRFLESLSMLLRELHRPT